MVMCLRAMLVFLVLFPTAVAAAEEKPPADPRSQLEYFVGTWTIAGEENYRETCRWTPGKRAIICETAGGFSLFNYEAPQRTYHHYGWSRDGVLEILSGWVEGGRWTFVGTTEKPGEHKRIQVVLTPTKSGFTFRQDVSVNSGPWKKEHDFEYVRLMPPAPE